MEYQVKTEVIDKIKIRCGTILNVNKYGRPLSYPHATMTRKNSKQVCKGIHKSKEEIVDRLEGVSTTYPTGTYFVYGNPVVLVEPKDYTFEVKVAGGTIVGNSDEVIRELEDIIKAIKEYETGE